MPDHFVGDPFFSHPVKTAHVCFLRNIGMAATGIIHYHPHYLWDKFLGWSTLPLSLRHDIKECSGTVTKGTSAGWVDGTDHVVRLVAEGRG